MVKRELIELHKQAVRNYMAKLVAVPGIITTIVAFVIGYMIKDVATEKAELEARNKLSASIASAQDEIDDALEPLRQNITAASFDLALVNENITLTKDQMDDLERTFRDQTTQTRFLANLGKVFDDQQELQSATEVFRQMSEEARRANTRIDALVNGVEPFESIRVGTLTATNSIKAPNISAKELGFDSLLRSTDSRFQVLLGESQSSIHLYHGRNQSGPRALLEVGADIAYGVFMGINNERWDFSSKRGQHKIEP